MTLTMFLQSGGSQGMTSMILFGGILLVFYFFIIRPQSKKQKEQNKFSNSLEKGAEVATGSGIVGRINKIEGDFVFLQLDSKTFIKVFRSAISKEMTDALKSDKKE